MQLEAKHEIMIMIIEFGVSSRSHPSRQNFHFENELGQRLWLLLFQEPIDMDRFQSMRMLRINCWPMLFVNFDQAQVLLIIDVSSAIIFD